MSEKPLEAVVGELLRAQGVTLGLAESSTGGLVGHRLTEVSGSSDYFVGSIVPYARDIQERLVGVAHETLERFGVVSEPVAREMARGARRQLRADIGLSVTGIASPHSGRSRKPIGLTFIALSADDLEACERHVWAGNRSQNKWQSSEAALSLLRRYLERRAELPALERAVAGIDPAGSPQLVIVKPAAGPTRATSHRRLGVLSSAFNPLTVAHVRMAELAQQACALTEVMLELSSVNVDKSVYGAALAERLWMLKRFAEGRPDFSVALCSHARFIDKAKAIRARYPAGTRLYFIVGYDTLVRVFDPKYYDDLETELRELFVGSRFVVSNRGPHSLADVRAWLEEPACRPFAGRIHPVELDAFHAALSSTQVRDRLRQGQDVGALVPDEIAGLMPLTALAGEPASGAG